MIICRPEYIQTCYHPITKATQRLTLTELQMDSSGSQISSWSTRSNILFAKKAITIIELKLNVMSTFGYISFHQMNSGFLKSLRNHYNTPITITVQDIENTAKYIFNGVMIKVKTVRYQWNTKQISATFYGPASLL